MMRKYLQNIIIVLVVSAFFVACSKENMGSADGNMLVIEVIPSDFSQDARFSTRASNIGYSFIYEASDSIGVTAVDADGNVLAACNNVKFVLNSEGDWLRDGKYNFVEKYKGASYFAYGPYDKANNGKTLSQIISSFQPELDQHTKVNYDKSDLMAVDGPVSPGSETLCFEMKHKMSLLSIFYNNEFEPDGLTSKYEIDLYSGSTPSSLNYTYFLGMNHRYIVKPGTDVALKGALQETNTRLFYISLTPIAGTFHLVTFVGEALVPYSDGVDLELENVQFNDKDNQPKKLGHKVIWSKYNLGESLGEEYPFDPAASDRGLKEGSRDSLARGDYYCWGATYTQYENGITGYHGYGYNSYFDKEYNIAPIGGTIKGTEYDVAHAKWWRGQWRLPTDDEFRALIAGCTITVETNYSETNKRYLGPVANASTNTFQVYKVTSKQNGNVIYISSGGYIDGTMQEEKDSNGNVTSSGSFFDYESNKINERKNVGIVNRANAYYLTSTSSNTIKGKVSYFQITYGASSPSVKLNQTGNRFTGMLARPVYSPDE